MKNKITLFFVCFITVLFPLVAQTSSGLAVQNLLQEGVNVDLRDPLFCNGVLSTEKGGVISAPGIRIQAKKMIYTRHIEDDHQEYTIEAEEDLILEFGDYIFIGERLEYNFHTKEGILYCGVTRIFPWFVGGNIIQLYPDGSYCIKHAYLTTTESGETDWEITAKRVNLRQDRYLVAKGMRFRLLGYSLFYWPNVSLNLETLMERPIRVTTGWGGRQGPRLGIAYEFFAKDRWKAFLRADYRMRRGFGGGIETRYRSYDYREEFQTINYVARDISLFNTNERTRYRFQGFYSNWFWDDKISFELTYDKLSDEDMAADYEDQSLELIPSEHTQLEIRRQEDNWITTFLARVRINQFETLKQELPSFETAWKPFEIYSTGIISDNRIIASYLDFAYANDLPSPHDYQSSRCAFTHHLYRPFHWSFLNITPSLGGKAILYGDSPHRNGQYLLIGFAECDINSSWHRNYSGNRHILTPYLKYQFYTFPTSNPEHHFIFDIDDGWYHLNQLRVGLSQSLLMTNNCLLQRKIYADLYANAFFDTKTIPHLIPKAYGDLIWNVTPKLRHTFGTAWDFDHSQIDYFNVRSQWTLNPDFAISLEYRHREAFAWRKADHWNFILEFFRSNDELRHSSLSDRRDTALVHFFYRFLPNWALEVESLHGWHRHDHTRYTEFEVDLLGSLRSSSQIKIAYQHRQGDDRVAVYFSFGAQRPDHFHAGDLIPSLTY